ncbi:MAG: hypothetical protein WCS65_09865 [Verrucomicrobiae bacterium]
MRPPEKFPSSIARCFTRLAARGMLVLSSASCLALSLGGCSRHASDPQGEQPAAAQQLASQVNSDLGRIRAEVGQLARFLAELYPRKGELIAAAVKSQYAMAPTGAFYKPVNDQTAALWISGAVPITEQVKDVAYLTEPADAELIRICRTFPEVAQAYYNDRNSLNRIYPWFETVAQYPAKMNIPEFNFYYLADAAHNPGRGSVWVDEPYVDPAGRGWMVSAIAPVYEGDVLQGVAGLDVTIADIVGRYLNADRAPTAVIARSGVLVAATESAIQLLEMPPLKDHKYLETVKQDTFKSDEYNVLKTTLRPVREMARAVLEKPAASVPVVLHGKSWTAFSAPVSELGWAVVIFVAK